MPGSKTAYTGTGYTLPFLLFFTAIAAFFFTLSPSINFGDSPELISAAYGLGIAHPPGYPLYSIAGKFFALIPWGEGVAWRVNLASATFTALSIFLIARTLLVSGSCHFLPAIILSCLALAFSPTLWSQSVISEVYALNLFFFSLILYLSALWWQERDGRYLLAAAFIFGLGLGNHHTLVAIGPLFLLFLILRRGQTLCDLRFYILLFLFFILGLSVYLYIPVRSLQNPAMDWGDGERVKGFLDILLRRQFPTTEKGLTFHKGFGHALYYMKMLKTEFTLPLSLIGAWGLLRFFRFGLAPFLFLLLLFIIHGVGTLLFLNPSAETVADVDVMLIPSLAVFSIWVCYGISDMASFLSAQRGGKFVTPLLVLALSALVGYSAVSAYAKNNLKNNYFTYDYAQNIFKSVGRDGVVFTESDNTLFPLWYLQQVEGLRTDVAVIDVDFLMLPWFKKQISERYKNLHINVEDLSRHAGEGKRARNFSDTIDAFKVSQIESVAMELIETRPLYISYEFGPVYRMFRNDKGIMVMEDGLLFRILKKYRNPDVEVWDSFNLRSLTDPSINLSPYARALSVAYVKIVERRAWLLWQTGKKEEAMMMKKRAEEIKREAAAYY